MAQPVFSILISTFCRAPLVGDAINSVLAQDFGDFEIIVSDNWSGDSTPEVLATFTDPRITVTRPPQHCSNADNLEHALSLATGTYVLVLAVTDALVGGALTTFKRAIDATKATFAFSIAADYFDDAFVPAAQASKLVLPGGSGRTLRISATEYLAPLYALSPSLPVRLSSYVVARSACDEVKLKFGVVFTGEGPEFFAWPAVMSVARRVTMVDQALVVIRHTPNPPSEPAADGTTPEAVYAIHHAWENDLVTAPVCAHAETNLLAEGIWRAQQQMSGAKLARFGRDEHRYAELLGAELSRLRDAGKDMGDAPANLAAWSAKLPTTVERRVRRNRLVAKYAARVTQARRARGYAKATVVDCTTDNIHTMLDACRHVERASSRP